MRIAVVGGTGRIGRLVVERLVGQCHEAVSLSRADGVDLLSGAGLADRLVGVEALVDVTNLPATDGSEAERVFTAVSRNLLAAEVAAGVRHHVALSIAALGSVRGPAHYAGKRAQEQEVTSGGVPFTIVRATQFHDFPAMIAQRATVDGVAPIPPVLLQPVAPADVADVLVEHALGDPIGTVELAGPYPEDAVDMARRTFAARGEAVTLRPSWRGTTFGLECAGEAMLASPEARIAPTSFDRWLAAGAR